MVPVAGTKRSSRNSQKRKLMAQPTAKNCERSQPGASTFQNSGSSQRARTCSEASNVSRMCLRGAAIACGRSPPVRWASG